MPAYQSPRNYAAAEPDSVVIRGEQAEPLGSLRVVIAGQALDQLLLAVAPAANADLPP